MRQLTLNSVFKLVGVGAVVLVGVMWTASRGRPPVQAQGIAAPQLPLTTAYFYGPVSASENHLVKMCSNNLFGDGSVRFAGAIINAADGRVLVGQDLTLPRRGGDCLKYQPTESLDVLGVLWSLGGASGDLVWSSPRASGPVAALQLLDAESRVVAILNTPGKVIVDSDLLPAVQ
jgi:hypothetical protein